MQSLKKSQWRVGMLHSTKKNKKHTHAPSAICDELRGPGFKLMWVAAAPASASLSTVTTGKTTVLKHHHKRMLDHMQPKVGSQRMSVGIDQKKKHV